MKKTILITGATGFLGHHLVKRLLEEKDVCILAICGRPEDKSNPLPPSKQLQFYDIDQFFSENFPVIDDVVNCAFPRSNNPEQLIGGLDFTERLIHRIEELQINSVINISSQGVYKRLPKGVLSKEHSPIIPIDLYSMVKYATEKMFLTSSIQNISNIRLASLIMPQRFLYFFINKSICEGHFTLTAPNQYASLLDVRDAVSGLTALLYIPPEKRASTYNLGINRQYSLLEYANSVIEIGQSMGYNISFDINDNGTTVCAGMDSSRLINDTGWNPVYLKDEMIKDLFHSLRV